MNKTPLSKTIEIEIPFFDVDSMEITWHGHYLKYFELARCALLEKIGYDYQQMRDSGYAWPIVDVRIKYIRPTRFLQKIIIEAILEEYENRIKMKYIVRDKESGEKLTEGTSIQMAIDLKKEKALLVSPKILIDKVEAAL